MTQDAIYDAIYEQIEHLSDSDLMQLHNEMCDNYGDLDNTIFENDENFFNEMFSSPIEAVRATHYGDYKFTDKYVKFDGYANLESGEYVEYLTDFDELTNYVIENEVTDYGIEFPEEEDEDEDE